MQLRGKTRAIIEKKWYNRGIPRKINPARKKNR